MRHAIFLPEVGAENEPVRVSGWLADVGDTIIAGDIVAEVLLPGITFDVEATQSGQLVRIEKPIDALVASGDVLGWIDEVVEESVTECPLDDSDTSS